MMVAIAFAACEGFAARLVAGVVTVFVLVMEYVLLQNFRVFFDAGPPLLIFWLYSLFEARVS